MVEALDIRSPPILLLVARDKAMVMKTRCRPCHPYLTKRREAAESKCNDESIPLMDELCYMSVKLRCKIFTLYFSIT